MAQAKTLSSLGTASLPCFQPPTHACLIFHAISSPAPYPSPCLQGFSYPLTPASSLMVLQVQPSFHPDFRYSLPRGLLSDNVTIGLIGDWGTGMPQVSPSST